MEVGILLREGKERGGAREAGLELSEGSDGIASVDSKIQREKVKSSK